MRSTVAAGMALALVVVSAHAETIDFIPNIGLACGKGFDSLAAEVKRAPFTSRQTLELPGGQTVDHDLRLVESVVQLEESLDVSASGSYGAGLFKASAKADYMRSHSMDQYSLYCLVACKVKNRETELETLELSQAARDLLDSPNGLELFHKAYGDRFVAGIAYGGEYYGVLRIETKSETDRQDISASLSASGFGWSASGSMEHSLSQYSRDHSLSVKNIMIGGAGLEPPGTVAEMIDLGKRFPGVIQSQGYPVKVILSDYSVFPEYQRKLTDLDLSAKLVMKDVAFNYLDYQAMRNDIGFILENPDQFRFQNDGHKRTKLQELRNKKREIDRLMVRLEDAKQGLIDGRVTASSFAGLGITPAEDFGASLLLPPRYRAYAKDQSFQPPPRRAFPIDHVRKGITVDRLDGRGRVRAGDAEVKGHRPWIHVDAELLPFQQGTKLKLRTRVRMQESKRDWTTFRSHYTDEVYDVTHHHRDLRIERVYPNSGTVRERAGKNDHGSHDFPGRGLIEKAMGTTSDSKGKEIGDVGVRSIRFRPVTIEFAHLEDVRNEPYHLERYFPAPAGPAVVGGIKVRNIRPVQALSRVAEPARVLSGSSKNTGFWFRGLTKKKPQLLRSLGVPKTLSPRPVASPAARPVSPARRKLQQIRKLRERRRTRRHK